ncbi:coiled-coil domain-containing protein 169 [Trichonephila clavipes]|nr:coiled-coil domain-containing protein 169 [Trichonephila clavipes]
MYSRRQNKSVGSKATDAGKDVETLRSEIENEQRMTEMLDLSIEELQKTIDALEQQVDHADIADEDEWKVRYYTQVEVNEQLERQRDWLMERVEAARNQSQEGVSALLAELDLDSLTESQLLRYLKQLEKDRNSLYNELRDKEWKLDQESKTFHKYNDTRKAYMTEITEAMLNLEAMKSRLRTFEGSENGSIAKCPRHLKYLNILPDQRVIDPRKGPIKKTAAVRSLPKLNTADKDFNDDDDDLLDKQKAGETSNDRRSTYQSQNFRNSNKCSVKEVSKAHLDPEEQDVELEAVKYHREESQDFNAELKENIDRMLEKTKGNVLQYKKRLKPAFDHMELGNSFQIPLTYDPAYEAEESCYSQNGWLLHPSTPVGVVSTLN